MKIVFKEILLRYIGRTDPMNYFYSYSSHSITRDSKIA